MIIIFWCNNFILDLGQWIQDGGFLRLQLSYITPLTIKYDSNDTIGVIGRNTKQTRVIISLSASCFTNISITYPRRRLVGSISHPQRIAYLLVHLFPADMDSLCHWKHRFFQQRQHKQ